MSSESILHGRWVVDNKIIRRECSSRDKEKVTIR